jgi:hypothetical protein
MNMGGAQGGYIRKQQSAPMQGYSHQNNSMGQGNNSARRGNPSGGMQTRGGAAFGI